MKYCFAFIFLIPLLLLNSCNNDRLLVDVSNIDIDFSVKRLDKDFLPLDTINAINQDQKLAAKYSSFWSFYLQTVLQVKEFRGKNAIKFLANDPIYEVVLKVQNGINQMDEEIELQEQSLEEGFKHLKYYFPDQKLPEVIFYNSWFQYGVLSVDNFLAIGLDFFVPDTSLQKLYPPQFYKYKKIDMRPDYIAINGMSGHLQNVVFPVTGDETNLLSQMIYFGKIRYLLKAMFPEKGDAEIMNYTPEEIDWCNQNQLAIWRLMTTIDSDEEIPIFSENRSKINKWISAGPFTSVVSEDSPDRLGEWIGLQMIKDFMDEHPEIELTEMLKKEPRKIRKFYNPKR